MDKAQRVEVGQYSVVTYRKDCLRGPERNIGVLVIRPDDRPASSHRFVSASSITKGVAEHGLLDAALQGLRLQMEAVDSAAATGWLLSLSERLAGPVRVLPPLPAVVADVDAVAASLFKAFVVSADRIPTGLTKGRMIDLVARRLRHVGASVHVAPTVGDCRFDMSIGARSSEALVHVASLATTQVERLARIEDEVGHFIFALGRVGKAGFCVLQPPKASAPLEMQQAHRKISSWLSDEGVHHLPLSAVGRTSNPASPVAAAALWPDADFAPSLELQLMVSGPGGNAALANAST